MIVSFDVLSVNYHARIQRGDRGVGTPPEKSQKYMFLSNIGLDLLKKKYNCAKAAFNAGPSSAHQRTTI